MRLGYAPFGRVGAGVVQNASQFGGFGQIQAISGRLRRILDQAPGKTPDPPETQRPFGPPGRRVTGSLGHQLVVPQGHRPTGLPGRLGGRQRALFRLRGLCRVAYAGLARGPRRVEPSGADSPAGEPPRGLRTHNTEKGPGLVGMDEAGALGASAPPTRSPERRSRRTPGRSRPASSPAPRGRDRWRRRRTAGPCRPCAVPGSPSSSPRPSCPG